MIKKFPLIAAFAVAFHLITTIAMAGEIKPFNQDAFTEAKAAGKTVVLDFHADWCPVCRKQGPLLQSLVQEDKLKDVLVFKVNYDKESTLKKDLKVKDQSTLIVFKGKDEVSRATWETNKDQVRALIEKGL